jgi:uncharacterized protein (TIGR04255 family)
MPFPETRRVIYRRNPLKEVICQLRFPPILRIETSPADFQDMVRSEFPEFTQNLETLGLTPSSLISRFPLEIAQQINLAKSVNYEFSSADGAWKTNLARNFVSLSTKAYERWETFREKLEIPLRALIQVYEPHSFSRIGLRYIDVIQRSRLGLDDVSWSELLRPELLGLMGSRDMADTIRAFQSSYELELENERDMVRIVSGFSEDGQDPEKCYVIDSDFFTSEPIALGDAMRKLDYFNVRASRLIRWCITETLHTAMEPSDL